MLEWIKENKDYASLYSAMVATGAFVFSIFTFLVSVIRAKKDRKVSDYRYYEQQKQYEKEISRLQEQRNEDKYDTEEKIRINEEPYFVFRNSKISTESNIEQTVLQMTFINKGRESAYNIIPDLNCTAKRLNMTEFAIHRYDAVRDPIAMVGEKFVILMAYDKSEKNFFRMSISIKFEDASGRKYVQTFNIDILDRAGNGRMINYPQPRLCKNS